MINSFSGPYRANCRWRSGPTHLRESVALQIVATRLELVLCVRQSCAPGHVEVGAVIRGDVELEAILKLDPAEPGASPSNVFVGKGTGAEQDDAVHAGDKDL